MKKYIKIGILAGCLMVSGCSFSDKNKCNLSKIDSGACKVDSTGYFYGYSYSFKKIKDVENYSMLNFDGETFIIDKKIAGELESKGKLENYEYYKVEYKTYTLNDSRYNFVTKISKYNDLING